MRPHGPLRAASAHSISNNSNPSQGISHPWSGDLFSLAEAAITRFALSLVTTPCDAYRGVGPCAGRPS